MRGVTTATGALGLVLLGAAACGGSNTTTPAVSAPHTAALPASAPLGCERTTPAASAPKPLTGARQGASVALARHGDKTLAFIADEDEHAIQVVDVDADKQLSSTPVDGRPSQVAFLGDGRLAVTLRDASKLQILEPTAELDAPLVKRCSVATAVEPVGLAVAPDDATIVVSSGWGRALAGFDAAKLGKKYQVALAREPRAVVLSDDGKKAFVSHAVGAQASQVDLAGDDHKVRAIPLRSTDAGRSAAAMRRFKRQADANASEGEEDDRSKPSCQGYALAKTVAPAGRIFAPQVLVDPGDIMQRTQGYGDENGTTESPDVAVIDAASGKPFAASLEREDRSWSLSGEDPRDLVHKECLLPRAAAVEPKTNTLLVACYGIDAVVAYDALAANPVRAEKRRWSVGAGPNGIAIDAEKGRAVIWSQFDRSLNRISVTGPELVDEKGKTPARVAHLDLPATPARKISVAAALGRLLFHASGDSRVSRDGRACASCHPDGRDDAITWATPEGPRRSIMLAGRISDTGPYSWSNDEHSLKQHLTTTFERLSGAGGLKSVELDALAAFISSLPAPPKAMDLDPKKVRRGKEIFASKDAACASCHSEKATTDGKHHDVKSKTQADRGPAFNTPSLRGIGGTGPYFHDGRYATLHELLTSNDDRMGKTKHLSADDLDALETYLRSL